MQSRAIIVSRLVALAAGLALLAPSGMRSFAQGTAAGAEWRAYAGTTASTKYSPLDQINRNTVKNLRIAWRQSVTPVDVREGANAPAPTNYQHTPLMVGGLVYMITGYGSVAALWFQGINIISPPLPVGVHVIHLDATNIVPGFFGVVYNNTWIVTVTPH